MKHSVEIFATSLVATVLFAGVHFVLQPAPVPALGSLAGGLVAYWIVRHKRYSAAAVGAIVGSLVGVGFHFYSHYSEGRIEEPPEGIALHLVKDGLFGLLIAGLILAVTIWAVGRLAGDSS